MKNVYDHFSKLRLLSTNYTLKFLFIAFIGVHIPVIVLIAAIAFDWLPLKGWNIILIALLATLAATAATLLLLRGLLWPIHEAKKALSDYTAFKKTPSLPVHYHDEAGQLLQQVQITIDSINALLVERKDILSLLSHDLRTPFTQMSGLGELLQTEKDPETIAQYGALIQKVATEQLQFIQDILLLLRAGEDEMQSHLFERKYVSDVLAAAMATHELSAAQKGIRLSLHNIPDIQVKCHLRLLSQAFANIIGNAIKFSHRNSEIIIKVHLFSGYVHVMIADTGIGFEPEKTELIFQKFTTEGKSGTEGEISSGIGLYLTRKVIQNHQGKIGAFSEGKNKGAVITVQLPIAE